MKKENFLHFGTFSKTHGFKGELILLLTGSVSGKFKIPESVFIDINGQLIPFFIDWGQVTGTSSMLIKLHDVDSEEKARKLVKCYVFVPLGSQPLLKDKKQELTELNGYKVIDEVHGEIGFINKILDIPQQLIFEIHQGSIEILIPANEEIISKIDKKNKTVFLNAPEGLIDIYLDKKT